MLRTKFHPIIQSDSRVRFYIIVFYVLVTEATLDFQPGTEVMKKISCLTQQSMTCFLPMLKRNSYL